ncbi:hypothetical protein [Micromonospora qiuiae]|nr:hypothetical protein [Micromonospora qiuiae]
MQMIISMIAGVVADFSASSLPTLKQGTALSDVIFTEWVKWVS